MKKVCIFNFPRMDNFHGYSIDSLDPVPYFPQANSWWRGRLLLRKFVEAKWIDQMYRDRDPSYMRFAHDFVEKFKDAEVIVCATYAPIHPEILHRELPRPVKILGFCDEPDSTYIRGIPYLWAFDGAFYITPSFNEDMLFSDVLRWWGCEHTYWFKQVPPQTPSLGRSGFWPLAATRAEALRRGDGFFQDRDLDLVYVGQQYDRKLDRLVQLRERFGSRFHLYGRWRFKGYGGMARGLLGKPPLWMRVRPLSNQERTAVYYRTKIGFNMHLSPRPRETGNMRMYEVPAHGVMLLCDKAGSNAHELIFEPDKEAVFYDSIEDAIDKIEYYLQHDDERERIARAGFARVHRDYDGDSNLKKFLDWACGVPKKKLLASEKQRGLTGAVRGESGPPADIKRQG